MQVLRFASAGALVALAGAPALADVSPVVDVVPADQVVEDDPPPQQPPPGATLPAAPLPVLEARSVVPVTGRRKPTGTFTIGAGYSPDDGFLAGASIVQPDLFRTGQRLALTAEVSAIRQRFGLAYDIPNVLPAIDLHTEIVNQRRDYGAFTREGTGGELGLAYKLDRHTRIYGRYRIEEVETALDPLDAKPGELPMMTAERLGNGTVATLGAGIVHDTLDHRWLPYRGTRLELFTDRAAARWGSDYTFERTGGSLDLARGLGPLTLRVHGHATYIRSSDPMGVPLSERLQHDGHAEVRGYALDSLPPLGSNFEAVGRVELELPLWRKAGLSIAGWADAGMRQNSDAMYGATGDPAFQRSLGVSLIWNTPIGPLRFDVAFPLDGKDRDRQYLFGLGGWWW